MRSKGREMIKLFVGGMIFYSCCEWNIAAAQRQISETHSSSQTGTKQMLQKLPKTYKKIMKLEPVAEICHNIFAEYTDVKYNLGKIKEKLGGVSLDFQWDWKFSDREQKQICSNANKIFSEVLDSPPVMLCTQRVNNFMTKHEMLYKDTRKHCKRRDRWTDLNCGKRHAFQKCLEKRMPATLRYLLRKYESNIVKCRMCKEVLNLKKCGSQAFLCRKLTKLLYSWHRKKVASLSCGKCQDTSAADFSITFASFTQTSLKETGRPTKIAVHGSTTKTSLETTERPGNFSITDASSMQTTLNETRSRTKIAVHGRTKKTSLETTKGSSEITYHSTSTKTPLTAKKTSKSTENAPTNSTKQRPLANPHANRKLVGIIGGVAGLVVVLTGVVYTLYRYSRFNRELNIQIDSVTSLGSSLSLTSLKKGHGYGVRGFISSTSTSSQSSRSDQSSRRQRRKQRK